MIVKGLFIYEKLIDVLIFRMIVPVETKNWSNNKVHVCVLIGLAGQRMEYAAATIHFKIVNKILSENVNQSSTMTRRREKNGALMLRLPV